MMRIIRRLRSALVIPVLALLPLAGCFESANTNQLSCTKDKYCPDGYVCVGAQPGAPGRCQKSTDGGGADGTIAIDSPRGGDASSFLDGSASPTDGPALVADMVVALDQSSSVDVAIGPETAPDAPAAVDFGRDVPSDAPPISPPDLGLDQQPNVAPEVGPDLSTTSCVIGGSSYASGAANPANTCQICKPAASSSGWSNADEGTSCNGANYCNSGACKPGCFISGAYYANGAANPANACQTCQTAYALTSWTTSANGAGCGTGQVCNGGLCQSGCWIAGALVGSGTTNSSNACQICKPASSTSNWSDNADGTSCGAGKTCSVGICQCTTGTDCGSSGCINVNGSDSSHCGSCTNVCAAGQSCGSGKCACTKGAPVCGSCLAWDFESGPGSTSGWAIGGEPDATASGNGATNVQISSSKTNPANTNSQYSLAVPIAIYEDNMVPASVAVSPCQAGTPVNLAGYTLTAAVYLAGPAFAWTGGMHVNSYGPGGVYDWGIQMFNPLKNNDWNYLRYTFSQSIQVDHISIQLDANEYWVGTMYIDDVVITGP